MRSERGEFFSRRRAGIARAGALCLALLCLASCGRRETPAEKAAEDGVLILGNGADPASLDPSLATGTCEAKILNGLFEGLVCADQKDLSILPAAAESWEIFDGGLGYRFKIDPRAKWSDGSRVSAKDFEFAWKRTLSPELGSEYASLLFPIKNARAYNSGKEKNPDKVGVRAIGDGILSVRLEKPTPYFLSLLYHCAYFPLPRRTLAKFGAERSRGGVWTKPGNMVCNGAFKLEKWSINDRVVISRNPEYRAGEKIFLNKIVFLPVSNINTEDRAFRAGQMHITESVAPSRLAEIRALAPETLRSDRWIGVYYYAVNTSRPPLDNPDVRRALAMSIDRRAIIDSFLKAGQPPALSLVPGGCGGYELPDSAKMRENVAEARRLLAKAGYPGGKNFPAITITYNTSEQHKPIAEAVQQMWRKNLGVRAELLNLSWPAYLDARRRGDFDIARASWIGDYAAPESFLEIFRSDSGLNHSGFSDKSFDEKLGKARSAKSEKERFEILAEAEAELLQNAPIIPIYFYSRVFRISPLVKGWHANILDYRNYAGVKLEKRGGE